MKNSINNLRNQFTGTEMLTATQLCAIKGGAGEDLRKMMVTSKIVSTGIVARAL